ncbi:hypothetical protein P280DRAFT_130272 [Massarina eburnea CBS 473.64]|uniref:Uncharacterized protein n=1 Tax=Massarina eburnea CBS 473.64 TaxID=1395130 RepID=A0A6A6SDB4_9PLEO|nr:hypothetical protein P280DRAFT_130272 [Massarina eburnea CBS 473.64]
MTSLKRLEIEDDDHAQANFEMVRAHMIRKWYAESQSQDTSIRNKAAARLHLQNLIRKNWENTEIWRAERDRRIESGDVEGQNKARSKLKGLGFGKGDYYKFKKDGMPAHIELKYSKEWLMSPVPIEEFLAQSKYDRSAHFQDLSQEQQDVGDNGIMLPMEYSQKLRQEVASVDDILVKEAVIKGEQGTIWKSHRKAMKALLQNKGAVELVWETQLAVQKTHFKKQAGDELKVYRALKETERNHDNKPSRLTFPVNLNNPFVLWGLSSTILWDSFRGGDSWDSPGWTPSGHLRIQNTSGSASLILLFGNRAFVAPGIELPEHVSTQRAVYIAYCTSTAAEVRLEIQFLTNHYITVTILEYQLLKYDQVRRNYDQHGQTVQFAGVPLGDDSS